jgi:hypothetical protein
LAHRAWCRAGEGDKTRNTKVTEKPTGLPLTRGKEMEERKPWVGEQGRPSESVSRARAGVCRDRHQAESSARPSGFPSKRPGEKEKTKEISGGRRPGHAGQSSRRTADDSGRARRRHASVGRPANGGGVQWPRGEPSRCGCGVYLAWCRCRRARRSAAPADTAPGVCVMVMVVVR